MFTTTARAMAAKLALKMGEEDFSLLADLLDRDMEGLADAVTTIESARHPEIWKPLPASERAASERRVRSGE